MKKLLAILAAAVMLFGVFGGALAQPAARNTASAKEAQGVKAEAAPAVVSDPLIEAKKANATKDDPVYTLDEALNVDGGTLEFVSEGTYPWAVVVDGDRIYAKSTNEGMASTESTVSTVVTVPAGGGIVSFDFEAWGEGSDTYDWDNCRFFIDNTMVFRYGNHDLTWEHYEGVIDEGEHTLTWTFKKDSTQNATGDCFKLDDVRVGAPVAVESITAPAALNVPLYSSAEIEYTVLPADASNKAVTFTSGDETIATVDENGKVKGIAIGMTTVTVASVAYPSITATVNINVYDSGIVPALIYGNVLYDPAQQSEDDPTVAGNWISFYDYDPETYTIIGPSIEAYGHTYAYGNIYGYDKANNAYFILPFDQLGATNATYPGYQHENRMYSLSINYVDGILYGVGADSSGTVTLYAIDKDTGIPTAIGALGVNMLAFAINAQGEAYGIATNGNLYSVDLTTAAITAIGSTGCSVSYVQDMCFDYDTGILYWALCNDNDGFLMLVDTTDASCEFMGALGGGAGFELAGMFIIPANEPEPPADIHVTGVAVTPEEATIRVDETVTLTAVVTPVNAENKEVEWSSNNEDVAVVDPNGTVLGVAPGVAKITATTVDGGFSDSATITVLDSLGSLCYGWYFETDPAADGWNFIDSDGDGYNWVWNSASSYPYEGTGTINSNSYNPGALTPDNWAITPGVKLPSQSATFSFYARGITTSWYKEHFRVYIGTSADIADMVAISDEIEATAAYEQYSYDVSAYAGQMVYFAIRHYNCTDQYALYVDQVEVFGKGTIEGAHTLTINYQYEDGTEAAPTYTVTVFEGNAYSVESPVIDGFIANPAVVEGVVGNADITVTVTYVSDGYYTAAGWYFETDPNEEGWTFIDADGDGYNWIWQQDYSNPPYCTAYEGEGLIYSESYHNNEEGSGGTPLTPDNWAISPAVTLPTAEAVVYLYAQGQDSSGQGYDAEVFAIYAGTTPNIEDMVKVSEDYVTQYGYQKFSADLSAFAGETVYIAIRHYNVTDMFMLDVDNVVVKGRDADVEILPGDVDLDGRITFGDISALYMYILGLSDLEELGILNADFNQDGAVNFLDISDMYIYMTANG